jgi:hypothetical protein
MINPPIAETLARYHQDELLDQARRQRVARRLRDHRSARFPRRPIRARAGWWMVHAGVRLALGSQVRQPAGSLGVNPAP